VAADQQELATHLSHVSGFPSHRLDVTPQIPSEQELQDFDASMIDFSSFMDVVGLDFQLDHTGVVLNSSLNDTVLSTAMPPIESRTMLDHSLMNPDSVQTATPVANDTEGIHSCFFSPHALNTVDHESVESCSWEIHSRWRVSQSQWNDLNASLQPFRMNLDQFVLPSRISLSRYLAGFAEGHTHHHPFIHVPTLDIGKFHGIPDLTLAIAAVGAQYRHERSAALRLYRAARSIAMERLKSISGLKAQSERDNTPGVDGYSERHILNSQMSGSVKSMLLLTTFAAWQEDRTLVLESLNNQSILANMVRDKGLSETSPSDSEDWVEWARVESDRRAQFSAFCVLNMQSLAYDLPFPLMASEMNLRLPASSKKWVANTPLAWRSVETGDANPRTMCRAVELLYHPADTPHATVSPYGNYLLMHAVHQHIYLARQLSEQSQSLEPPETVVKRLEAVLHEWKQQWQKALGSVMDLENPVSFAATSLLGLAYIRLHFNMSCGEALRSCNPARVAFRARQVQVPRRGPHLTEALLHAVYPLDLTVQMGVDYLRKQQLHSWSVVHAFCGFHFAIFLSKWLQVLAADEPSKPLSSE
jgi:hypothetical protein